MFALALLTAVAVLLNLVSGAVLTNMFATSAGAIAPAGIFSVLGHRYVSEGAGTLVVVLALWITFGGKPLRVKIIGWVAVAFVAVEAVLGRMGAPLSPITGFWHAVLAMVLFALLAHLLVYTSPSWEKPAVPVTDSGWPSLIGLANYTVGALMLQVILGAAFRHNLISVLWHILCAFVVVIFGLGMVVMVTQVPANRPLRAPAIWLVCLLGVQVTLGMILISISQPTGHPLFAEFSVGAHVFVGASALAVGVINSMLVRKSVRAAKAAPAAPATS
jgi:hypothetical protein